MQIAELLFRCSHHGRNAAENRNVISSHDHAVVQAKAAVVTAAEFDRVSFEQSQTRCCRT